jgi:Cd2+/Zn2+-exporting ATPase
MRRAESLGITPPIATDVREFPGRGLSGKIGEDEVLVGNARLMAERKIPLPEAREGTVLYVAKGGDCLGTLTFRDTLKPTAKEAMAELDRLGIRQRELLTGDRHSAAREVGLALGLSPIHGELTPEDKYRRIEELCREGVLYAGDGINDAPAMALATFSVAMGKDALGAAVEAADAVIVSGEVAKIPLALRIARRTLAIAKQNIVFSLTVKAAALAVTALGILPAGVAMAVAMFADVGVCLLAVANAMRALRVPRGRAKTAP